jgi:hypothetical protein
MRVASSDIEKIRRELDPAFSYIILERQGTRGSIMDLVDLLARLGIPIVETNVHKNNLDRLIFLVVKLNPEKAKELSREYLSINLPEGVTCLFYDSLVENARKGLTGTAQHKSKGSGAPKPRRKRKMG